MKKIPLTQGKYTIVDDEDYESLSQHKWYAKKQSGTYYAVRNVTVSTKKQKTIRMHRVIMDAPSGMEVDHINHDGLDNRKSINLRLCDKHGNQRNQRIRKGTTSKYKGVHWQKEGRLWVAQAKRDGKQYYLGCSKNEIVAAKKYDTFVKDHYGEYAYLNFPEEENND